MEHMADDRRKNYYIKKNFQRGFILKFCLLVILGSIISGSVVYVMSKATVTTAFENSRLVIKSTADFILPAVMLSSALAVGLIGLLTIMVTLFTSHQIAGPLYRVEKDLEAVAAGDLKKKVNLRRKDELKSFASNLNGTIEKLRSDMEEIKRGVSALEPAAGNVKASKSLEDIKAILAKYTT
jgi:methyl-accepting chemotaxis protein